MMKFRQVLVPAAQVAQPIAFAVLGFGIMIATVFASRALGVMVLQLGVAALTVLAVFQLVTLPVEFDASARAKLQLVDRGILGRDEMKGVNETLDAAALTYVAGFVSTVGNLLYLLLQLAGGGRRDD